MRRSPESRQAESTSRGRRFEIEAPSASPEEAAAIAAALERFLGETAPAPQAASPRSRWQQAALREGVAVACSARRRLGPLRG